MKNRSFAKNKLSRATVENYNRTNQGGERRVGFDSWDDVSMASGNGNAGRQMARSTEPYVLNIVNAAVGPGLETAILFGRNRFGGVANFGSGVNITITMGVAGVPYEQLLQQSASEPFDIVKTRLSSSSTAQLDQSMTYVKTDSNGRLAQEPITVTSYLSPDQFVQTLRDIDYPMLIDGSTHIEYPILNATTVTASIYIAAKVNTGKPLQGKDAITEYDSVRVRSFKQ